MINLKDIKSYEVGQEALTRITDALDTKVSNDTEMKMRMAAATGVMKVFAKQQMRKGLSFDSIMSECEPIIAKLVDRGRALPNLRDSIATYLVREMRTPNILEELDEQIVEEIIEQVTSDELPEEIAGAVKEVQQAEIAVERAHMRYNNLLNLSIGQRSRKELHAKVGRAFGSDFGPLLASDR